MDGLGVHANAQIRNVEGDARRGAHVTAVIAAEHRLIGIHLKGVGIGDDGHLVHGDANGEVVLAITQQQTLARGMGVSHDPGITGGAALIVDVLVLPAVDAQLNVGGGQGAEQVGDVGLDHRVVIGPGVSAGFFLRLLEPDRIDVGDIVVLNHEGAGVSVSDLVPGEDNVVGVLAAGQIFRLVVNHNTPFPGVVIMIPFHRRVYLCILDTIDLYLEVLEPDAGIIRIPVPVIIKVVERVVDVGLDDRASIRIPHAVV